MGVLDEARNAVTVYVRSAETVAQEISGVIRGLDQSRQQLTRSGALGDSRDADLEKARARLNVACTRFQEAAEAARASCQPINTLMQRAFPP